LSRGTDFQKRSRHAYFDDHATAAAKGLARIEDCAKRIATHANTLSSLPPLSEGNVLETGITLGRIYHHVDDLPSKTMRDDMLRRLRGILPDGSQKEIDRRFKAVASVSSGYTWASRI
jgi:hypothetical protein